MSSRGRNSRSQRQLGQALVEFTLVFPLFLLILMAIVDFGWAFRGYIVTTNAAREGARWAIVGAESTGADGVIARTVDRSNGLLSDEQVSTYCNDVESTLKTCSAGDTVKVEIVYEYHYITPIGGLLHFFSGGHLTDPLRIKSSTSMRHE